MSNDKIFEIDVKVKACPFCGAAPDISTAIQTDACYYSNYYLCCSSFECPCQVYCCGDTIDEIVSAWNTRTEKSKEEKMYSIRIISKMKGKRYPCQTITTKISK